jgi:hypothetical protein
MLLLEAFVLPSTLSQKCRQGIIVAFTWMRLVGVNALLLWRAHTRCARIHPCHTDSASENFALTRKSVGEQMQCKACRSENLQKFAGELTASSLSINNLESTPVYVCQQVVVCLDCGVAELVVPPQELQLLKKMSASVRA